MNKNYGLVVRILCCLLMLHCYSTVLAGTISDRPKAIAFIERMAKQHQFDKEQLKNTLNQAVIKPGIIRSITNPWEAKPWYQYRPLFLNTARIQGGVEFWQKHAAALTKAEQTYGVPAEIIVAIIGVETRYGDITGSHRVIDALVTLGFDYPKRAAFFTRELEHFLLFTRKDKIDPLVPTGSYAGAMGVPQFMPSSFREYAVDFNNNGKRDIWNSYEDTIGSVGNYFAKHGWKRGQRIAVPVAIKGTQFEKYISKKLKPKHSVKQLTQAGVISQIKLDATAKATLLQYQLENGYDYWLGLRNFYIITRYNHSALYAMAAYQLAQEIKRTKDHN